MTVTPRHRWVRSAAVALWLVAAVYVIAAFFHYRNTGDWGLDSHAYWLTGHHSHLYGPAPGKPDAYLYSPAFATVIWPLTQLPWLAFLTVWAVIEFGAFAWLLAPLQARWRVPLLAFCACEAIAGDIYGLLGVAIVVGMRRPALWAFPALTKIVPAVGIPWFALRREWRSLGIAVGTTAAIALVSVAISPHAWSQWIHFLIDHRGHSTVLYPVRLPIGVGVLIYAARTNKPWLLAVAMTLALPMAGNAWTLTMLAPIPRLVVDARRTSRQRVPTDSTPERERVDA